MILVVDEDSQFRIQINSLYRDGDEVVVNIDEIAGLSGAMATHNPDVIVIGPSVPAENAVAEAARLSISHPEVSVVMAVGELDAGVLREAMRAGVKDIIEHGFSGEQVRAAITHAATISKRLKAPLDRETEPSDDSETRDSGKVITFFSTKGGVGKSVVSTNSAVTLAKLTGKRIVVLDLDLQFGDVAIMLQLTPNHTIYDVVQVMDRLDEDMLQGFLTGHSSGIKALLAPVRPHESDSITSNHIREIIGLLRKFFDYIVIDTPPTFSDVVLTALDESDLIYLIATMDMPSIKNIKLAIQTLKQLGYPEGIVKFILNRADSKVWLEIDEVEKSLGIEAEARIPSDRVVPRSVNKGIPVVIEQPKSPVAKSLQELAEKIRDTDVNKVDKTGGLQQNKGMRGLIRRLS